MAAKHIKSVVTGIRRRWKTGLARAMMIVGSAWTVTELATRVWADADAWLTQYSDVYSICIAIAAAAAFFVGTYEPHSVSFLVPTTNKKIRIGYGDIFKQETHWIIGVNEFFDGALGQAVSRESLHGQFITRNFGGDAVAFRAAVDEALIDEEATPVARAMQPSQKYRIGTTAVLPNGGYKVFLVALTETNLVTSKASASVPLLWTALQGVLSSVHHNGNGLPISMPLIGSGRSSLNLMPQHLLRLLILGLVDFGRKVEIPDLVNIVLSEDCFDSLDLREIKRDWQRY